MPETQNISNLQTKKRKNALRTRSSPNCGRDQGVFLKELRKTKKNMSG